MVGVLEDGEASSSRGGEQAGGGLVGHDERVELVTDRAYSQVCVVTTSKFVVTGRAGFLASESVSGGQGKEEGRDGRWRK